MATSLSLGVNESLFKSSPKFKQDFTETFSLGKSLQAKLGQTIELEAFIKVLLIQFLWR